MKKLIILLLFSFCGCALPPDYPLKPWHQPSFSPLDDSVYVRVGNGWVLRSVDSTGVDWNAYQKHLDSIKRAKKMKK